MYVLSTQVNYDILLTEIWIIIRVSENGAIFLTVGEKEEWKLVC